MQAFARMFAEIDRTTRTSEKVAALERYFRHAPPADAAWALWFLTGNRLKRAVKAVHLRQWAAEAADLPAWIVDECHEHVGDLAETLALILPGHGQSEPPSLARLVEDRLLPLAGASEFTQRALLRATWSELDTPQRFLWNKLLTGAFRVGVSQGLVARALAAVAGVAPAIMTHRLLGRWRPVAEEFTRLLAPDSPTDDPARPFPFYLASPLETRLTDLGDVRGWMIEWKWDGIRAQLLRRAGQVVLWSRGDEIITPGFPDLAGAAAALPEGTVLDGEILAWRDEVPLPFHPLQRRLNRRTATPALVAEVPVVFMAYDLLELAGADWRARPLQERREALNLLLGRTPAVASAPAQPSPSGAWIQEEFFPHPTPPLPAPPPRQVLRLSPSLQPDTWEDVAGFREQARAQGAEGVMLKRRDAPYGVGRQRGAWWKWKVTPFTCDAVLVAAQPGHGRRATLFTDYTFAVWEDSALVPVAKAYSGLTDAEIDAVDAFVRSHTTGRFGPLRTVTPDLVFELAFEGIARSTRHRSGLALRFPRIARWRKDKKPAEADTVDALRRLMERPTPGPPSNQTSPAPASGSGHPA